MSEISELATISKALLMEKDVDKIEYFQKFKLSLFLVFRLQSGYKIYVSIVQ